MSHDRRDGPGGHENNAIETANGIVGWTPRFRRFAKWKTRRMLRRQNDMIERAAIRQAFEDREADSMMECEGFAWMMTDEEARSINDDFYDMIWDDWSLDYDQPEFEEDPLWYDDPYIYDDPSWDWG